MKTRVVLALAVVGAALLIVGSRGAGSWADRGTIVASQSTTVPGAPPWSLDLDVPAAAHDYLLESTATVAAPSDRSDVTASPELRAGNDAGPAEIRPAQFARTVTGHGGAVVTTHAWLRVGQPGTYRVELINLHLSPADLAPQSWRLRLAENVPSEPGGAGLAGAGFVLLALAMVGWLFWPAAKSHSSRNATA